MYDDNDLNHDLNSVVQNMVDDMGLKVKSLGPDKLSMCSKKNIPRPYNRIIFGAPGTGKSHLLKHDQGEYFNYAGLYERITFHPAYSYAQFFGSYKPLSEGRDIFYRFVPGPFLRVLLRALIDDTNNYLLIIEEINRADVAAVFGDVFQLLDRDKNGVSEYSIDIPEELRQYLTDYPGEKEDYPYRKLLVDRLSDGKLKIPANFYIWATMNSADQGVMPLDTAFKRRWSFEYLDINYKEKEADFGPLTIPGSKKEYTWLKVREIVNNRLSSASGIPEDRWLGPFFIKKSDVVKTIKTDDSGRQEIVSDEKFQKIFKEKVLMYLYNDVVKYAEPGEIFQENYSSYSELLSDFDTRGMSIFSGQSEDL